MFRYSIVLFCAVVLLFNVEIILAGKCGRSRGGGHSCGSVGVGIHSYPRSPSPGEMSGGGRGSHKYPPSDSLVSSANSYGYTPNGGTGGTTNMNHHYHYNPPKKIIYASPPSGLPMSYPVYRGNLPQYVYKYKDSGSKYSNLLTGLALLNLGALAGGATGYAIGSRYSSSNNNYNYKPQHDEVCLFGIKKNNGDFEETTIDCQLISSYIYADQKTQQQNQTSVTTTTVTNQTVVTNHTLDAFVLSLNGTLVVSPDAGNATNGVPGTVTTVTIMRVVNATEVKGAPIQVTPEMKCYVMRKTPTSRMKHEIPCGLLQTYAEKSIKPKPNSVAQNVLLLLLLLAPTGH